MQKFHHYKQKKKTIMDGQITNENRQQNQYENIIKDKRIKMEKRNKTN